MWKVRLIRDGGTIVLKRDDLPKTLLYQERYYSLYYINQSNKVADYREKYKIPTCRDLHKGG